MIVKRFFCGFAFIAQHYLGTCILCMGLIDEFQLLGLLPAFVIADWLILRNNRKKDFLSKGAVCLALPADLLLCLPLLAWALWGCMLTKHVELILIVLYGLVFVGLRFWLLWRAYRVEGKR